MVWKQYALDSGFAVVSVVGESQEMSLMYSLSNVVRTADGQSIRCARVFFLPDDVKSIDVVSSCWFGLTFTIFRWDVIQEREICMLKYSCFPLLLRLSSLMKRVEIMVL